MARAYELLYEALKPRLAACDLEKSAARRGWPPPLDGLIHCDFLGRRYLISGSGVEPEDGRPVNINIRSLLIHYLLSEGNCVPAGEFVSMSHLTGMVPSQNAHDGFFSKPLRLFFGPQHCGPIKAAEDLGGVLEKPAKTGEHHWHFQVLPQIAMKLIHYEADDEYPLEFKYLFDRNAVKILEYECLAFLIGCFNHELIAAARE